MLNHTTDTPLSFSTKFVFDLFRFLSGVSFYLGLVLVCFKELNFFTGLAFSFLPLITLPLISYLEIKKNKTKIIY